MADGVTPLSGIVEIKCSGITSVALKNDGTLWSWGYNHYGQLGDGSTADSSSHVEITGF